MTEFFSPTPRPSPTQQDTDGEFPRCSAKGCRADAVHALEWANPRIHTGGRRKTWLACAEHLETLGEFLRVRGFLKDVRPFQADRDS